MATTNLGKVSVTPKGEYDPLVTYERLDVISHNGSSYIVKQTSTGVTPIEGEFYALIAEKGDGGSFVKKAYKTFAAMDADKVNIPANSSVDVTNDPDESKNGAYIYDGVAFTRSQYDSKVVTDKIIADAASAVQDAINNTAVEGGVLADTFVTATANGVGAVARTQRDKNADYMTIDDFGGDIVAAGKWVKSSVKNFCKLNANEVYEISETGLVYLNRMICEDGRARIVVSEGSELTYEDEGVGDFVLRNIELIILGKRVGQSSGSTGYVFKRTDTAVNTVDIYGVTAYGLTDANDINSWSDDLGKTRAPALFRVLVNTHSNIENLTTYGLAGGVVVTPNTLSATHREKSIKGYNCETLVYLSGATWASGESKDLSIYNTDEQCLYWRGQSVGRVENGLDTLLCEADHTHEYKVDNVFGENVIERSMYMQSNIVTISNVEDIGSSTMAGTKMGLSGIFPDTKAIVRNIRGHNLRTTSVCQQLYGYSVYDIKDVSITNDVYTPYHRGVSISDTNHVVIRDGYFKNIGTSFYLGGSYKINEITISDFKLVNCGAVNHSNLWQRRVDASVGVLRFKNIESFWDDLVLAGSSIASIGSAFHDIDKLYMDNVELYATATPFTCSNVGYTEITNCSFTMVRAQSISVMWTTLDSSGGATGLRANVFDFVVRIIPTTTNRDSLGTAEIKFKKTQDTGIVNCKDYWREFTYNHPCKELSNTPIAAILNKPFECLVSLGSSQLKMTYNPETNALTEIYNIGDALSSVETAGKISVSVVGANLHIRVQEGAWIGTNETVSVVCTR